MDLLKKHDIPLEQTVKHGRWTFDAQIAGSKILIEADGAYWHSLPKTQERDKRKDEWCKRNGFELIRVSELPFYKDPEAAVEAILRRAEAENLSVARAG